MERILRADPGTVPRVVVPVIFQGIPRWFRVHSVAEDRRVLFELVEGNAKPTSHVGPLTESEKFDINLLRKNGETLSGIARKLGVKESRVRAFLNA